MGAIVDLQEVFAQGLAAVGALGIDGGHDHVEQEPCCTNQQSANQALQAADDEDHQCAGKKGNGNGKL